VCAQEEPVLEGKGSGSLAACHFPLSEQEARERLPSALA
jgi:peptide/nickel transport system ATP-binding protein/oligopeptide transport system ATP-binding protein